MCPISDKSLREIEEFISLGFARSTDALLRYMRRNDDSCTSHIRIFRPGVSARAGRQGSTTYTSSDIFGCTFGLLYLYDIRRKEEFVDFLVDKFIASNPNPDTGIRKAFTRILHTNKLHWKGCCRMNRGKVTE